MIYNVKNFGFLVGVILLLLIPILLVSLFLIKPGQEVNHTQLITPSPLPEGIAPDTSISLGKTIPGQTKKQDLINIIGLREVPDESENTSFEYDSMLNTRPNQIVTFGDTVIFERALITPDQFDSGIKFSIIREGYGEPEHALKGSSYYGSYLYTYIYASRGAAFIVNPNVDEIYEVHYFIPTSVENYIQIYGSDINTNLTEEHDHSF